MVSEEKVREALRRVFDPELGLNVVDLGLIYGIAIDGGRVRVTMTLTTQGCPLQHAMTGWVREAVAALDGVAAVDVDVVFTPPWTPERMSEAARQGLGV